MYKKFVSLLDKLFFKCYLTDDTREKDIKKEETKMSKAKIITGAGIVAAGSLLSGTKAPDINTSTAQITRLIDTTLKTPDSSPDSIPLTKRVAQKIYHRFEEIPEISDKEALLYNKEEYTYIVNAEKYQKDGTIELKRVLKDELTQANVLSVIYRSECATYIPKENEDQITKYDINLKLLNPSGKYKGPSQMNDIGVLLFVRYLAANPQTRQYVLPLLKVSEGSVQDATAQLEKKFFTDDGTLRPMDEREAVLCGAAYRNIKLKDTAWQSLASDELKRFISTEEKKRKTRLTNTTKNYLCLTEMFPDEQTMQNALEDFNLAFFPLARLGKPKFVMAALARSLNLKDKSGNLDATRIPTFAIAAAQSHINWKGNGVKALSQAQTLRHTLSSETDKNKKLCYFVKQWVSGKGKQGIDELAKLNIITPKLICQYQAIELPGAKNLAQNYQQAVNQAEARLNKQATQTLVLTAKNFQRQR